MQDLSVPKRLEEIEKKYNKYLLSEDEKNADVLSELRASYRLQVEKMTPFEQVYYFFSGQIFDVLPNNSGLICIAVIKDEPNIALLLDRLISQGFDRVVLVDDRSDISYIPSMQDYGFVSMLKAKAGVFGLSKTLWIESICNFLFDGSWVATLDADEFPELDSIYSTPPSFHYLTASSQDIKFYLQGYPYAFVPFCLLDVHPSMLSHAAKSIADSTFLYYFSLEICALKGYGMLPAVRWSFGKRYKAQFYTDLRFHLYGIAESRSKISFVLWNKSHKLMLHQGFHNITNRLTGEVYDINLARVLNIPCKTILHQKILFTYLNPPAAEKLSQYFPRTAANISRLSDSLATQNSTNISEAKPLHIFQGTIFMPSWTFQGKIVYVDEALLDSRVNLLRQEYEFVRIGEYAYHSLLLNLCRFIGQRIVFINRQRKFIQVRNMYH